MKYRARIEYFLSIVLLVSFLYIFSKSLERLTADQVGTYNYIEEGQEYMKFPSFTFCPPWWSQNKTLTNNLKKSSLNASFILDLMAMDQYFINRQVLIALVQRLAVSN